MIAKGSSTSIVLSTGQPFPEVTVTVYVPLGRFVNTLPTKTTPVGEGLIAYV